MKNIFSFSLQERKLKNGNTVYLKTLSALDKVEIIDRLQRALEGTEESKKSALRTSLEDSAFILSKGLCNESGERYFGDGEHLGLAGALDEKDLFSLSEEVLRENILTAQSEDDLKKK